MTSSNIQDSAFTTESTSNTTSSGPDQAHLKVVETIMQAQKAAGVQLQEENAKTRSIKDTSPNTDAYTAVASYVQIVNPLEYGIDFLEAFEYLEQNSEHISDLKNPNDEKLAAIASMHNKALKENPDLPLADFVKDIADIFDSAINEIEKKLKPVYEARKEIAIQEAAQRGEKKAMSVEPIKFITTIMRVVDGEGYNWNMQVSIRGFYPSGQLTAVIHDSNNYKFENIYDYPTDYKGPDRYLLAFRSCLQFALAGRNMKYDINLAPIDRGNAS